MATTATSTDSFSGDLEAEAAGKPGWALMVALDGDRLHVPPSRFTLGDIEEVEIRRGDARRFVRLSSRAAVLELPDRWTSQQQARLVRHEGRFRIEDLASKNGTYRGRQRVEIADLDDGDVVGCGATLLVLRRTHGLCADMPRPTASPAALRTLSPTFERELAVLPKIARSRLSVLVRGDSGTGKELIANAVHTLSGRSGPFIAVNCGAIPATLIESELFGSKRGAFSGAEDRAGIVRGAHGGTLFLDEIAELPATSQVALLRVLQEGEIAPLGHGRSVAVDVRVVAASHQPLEELIERGQLRRDLYARLRGHEVRLPPLRARVEDLGLLTSALLARIDPDGAPRTLAPRAGRELFAHRFPFHVRELEQILRGAMATADGAEIRASDLRLQDETPDSAPSSGESEGRERLVTELERHRGNISAVARALSTSRSQVQRLLDRHELSASAYQRR